MVEEMTESRSSVLEIRDLSVTYGKDAERPKAIDHLSLTIEEGEFVGVMGANGAGKTTLALAALGIIPTYMDVVFDGSVLANGRSTLECTVSEVTQSGISIVFQEPDLQLVSVNVELEIAFPLENLGVPREIIRERITNALSTVRLSGYEKRAPTELSGGQKQAVCIATGLATEPKLIVLDEPTSQLDPIGSQLVFEALRRINREKGIAILMAEHKADLLARMADRIVVLDHGRKLMDDTPANVFQEVRELDKLGIPTPQVSRLAALIADEFAYEFAPFPLFEEQLAGQLKSRMANSSFTVAVPAINWGA